ncbi:MAG: HD domain-containing protein [Candidatus Spechtbacterales bacterium]
MDIPKEVKTITEGLQQAEFEAYIVGGCVRDLLLDKKPKDWDITTNAKPKDIQKIFPDSVYENNFGTVGVKTESDDESLKIIEVTTYRSEAKYTDKRHPDEVKFGVSLDEDLKRRDFTINAMAINIEPEAIRGLPAPTRLRVARGQGLRQAGKQQVHEVIDPFDGQKDLKQGVIQTVGVAQDRFDEDALRMLRAIRFATELNFTIESSTFEAIKHNAPSIKLIAHERIRDELVKMVASQFAHNGILFMQDSGLLDIILPEVSLGIGVGQNKHHIYTVFEHNLYALKWAAEHDYPLHVRFAALLHDVGKPQTKRGEGEDSTFYGHEVASAELAAKIMNRFKFPNKFAKKVVLLVRYHLFYYDVGEVTESSVRRLVAKVGPENMNDLVKVRICDRMGSGVPKSKPYRLRHFEYMVEKVQKDPISVLMLKVSGKDVMEHSGIKPGPGVGMILAVLLDEVLDDPAKNNKEYLKNKIKELSKKTEKELEKLEKSAIKKQEKFEELKNEELKKKYYL